MSVEFKKTYHKVVYSEDTWDLCINHADGPYPYMVAFGEPYLHHSCVESCTATRQKYATMRWPCGWCGKPIPGGLQGLFVLMTGDMNA